ncbi:cGMP-dependent protein kinase [Chloropicon primus]|uniref:cGMP-dependent protein kinase n=1 Tax=Chloropicon primus TaxID=1764295 RepID=A0A5B8MR44_9CHLO|nr:cGMP-dependent protein kinase [Chloropicon primus]UPR02127.1 cGMP-dependent protein kinase [Chloropicon primus]|eukprot:QDZ22903.1 cGMP-dependent protein kinase [Chloropicon primus]
MAERAIMALLDPRRNFKSDFDQQLVQETVDPIIAGYIRKKGLKPALRSILRITTDQNFREVWAKDFEHMLQKEGDLTRKELKEKVASGVDLELLRSRGATEHELEVAGVPPGKLDEEKMIEEDNYEEFLKNIFLQADKRMNDVNQREVASALNDLNKLTNYMNILVKDTTDYMSKTNDLMQNTGEAERYAGTTKGSLGSGRNVHQINLKDVSPDGATMDLTASRLASPMDSYTSQNDRDRRLSNAYEQRRLSNAYEQRRLSNAYEQRRLSNAYENRRLSNAMEGKTVASRGVGSQMEGNMSTINMTQFQLPGINAAANNIKFCKLLLQSGVKCFCFSRKNPAKAPTEYCLYRDGDQLFWKLKNKGKKTYLNVVSAAEGLPLWFTDGDILKNSFIKAKFLGKNFFERCSLQINMQDLRKKVAVECVLTFEADVIAEKLAFYLNTDALDDSMTKIRGTKRASIIMQTRSRAKTLQNQSQQGNFISQNEVKKQDKASNAFYTNTAARKKQEKTKKEAEFLLNAMSKCPVFNGISDELKNEVVQVARKTNIAEGMIVCQKGNFASNFYIVEEGSLLAYLSEMVDESSIPDIEYKKEDYFGECSLIFKSPNLHHVIADGDCVLWALDQETFKKVVSGNADLQKSLDTLLEVAIFNGLDDAMFANIILDFEVQKFGPDEVIVAMDSKTPRFYVLQGGTVDVAGNWYGKSETSDRVEKSLNIPGQFFGDFELCFDLNMARTYKAGAKGATLLTLSRQRFGELSDFIVEVSESNLKRQVLHSLPTFATLDDFEVMDVIDSFEVETVKKGELIIKKGDIGDKFYFIKTGECVVMDKDKDGNLKILTKIIGHASFGELALLSDDPRSAYVAADTDVELYSLTREAFRQLVDTANKQGSKSKTLSIISNIDLLNALSENDFSVLTDALNVENFSEGDRIIKSGDINDKLFIVSKGELLLTRDQESFTERVRLLPGNHFGERALMQAEHCFYNVTATRVTELLTLSRHVFEQYCGSLAGLLQTELKKTEEEGKLLRAGIDDFIDKGIIGRGAFGTVRLVKSKDSNKYYALKYLIKDNIVKKQQQRHLKQEISIMCMLEHAMIISLWKKWQDKKYIYLLTEICTGGELFMEIKKSKGFAEDRAKFYAACVASILIELRKKEVVFRDLKPENILISGDGYLKLIDFGFGKVLGKNKKTFSLCGTPDYVAPEILLNQGYNHSVDTWALGVLVYEMVANETPFKSSGGAKGILKNILNKKLQFPKDKFSGVSKECISFMSECLKKEPMHRLGYKDARELKSHPWFQEYGKHGWNALERKLIRPPYVPNDVNPEKIPTKEPKEGELEPPPDVHDYEIDSIFADFTAMNEVA